MTTYEPSTEAKKLRRRLHELLASVVPHHLIDKTIEAVLSEESGLITPDVHNAAVLAEVVCQRRWADRAEKAEIEVGKARSLINLAAVERARAVFTLVGDLQPSKTAKHDSTCHQRHAPCLAAKVRYALNGMER